MNNAGILQFADVELCPMAVFQQHFNVNCLGQVRMVKAFLPMIKRSKGRIVNISSVNGVYFFFSFFSSVRSSLLFSFTFVYFAPCVNTQMWLPLKQIFLHTQDISTANNWSLVLFFLFCFLFVCLFVCFFFPVKSIWRPP